MSLEKGMRKRFWIEAALAGLTGILLIVTLVWKDWIEIVFGVEPDVGSGELEWLIAFGFLLATVIFSLAATWEYRSTVRGGANA
jgi:hypothetical protein